MVHLERNLIAISLKEQLLARPAIEDLEKRGIKPKDGTKVRRTRTYAILQLKDVRTYVMIQPKGLWLGA